MEQWREIVLALRARLDREFDLLKDEKTATERELEALGIFIGVVSECLGMRDSRLGCEITYDDADTELKKVHIYLLLENVETYLIFYRNYAFWKISKK